MDYTDPNPEVMVEQISDVVYGMIINNIKLFIKILESNHVDKSVIKMCYAEYLNKCKSSGIPIPKTRSKMDLSRMPKKLANVYHQIESSNLLANEPRKLEINASETYNYKGFMYHPTSDPYYEGQVLCCDNMGRIMLIWDNNTQEEVDLTNEDIEWLTNNNYRIHPMFMMKF